ncbi:MAG: L-threonylcarbamoyladenylate synthase [Candidatus Dormibacteraeota bacterium]|nr:L-threonylcarbamoyladenylate synthase [Candidatus Dormibacteraeota bacterium]
MNTERWPADAARIARAAARLRKGAVIAFPTDTLYAVGARAADPVAVQRLYEVKRRPPAQPLVLLVRGIDDFARVAIVSTEAADLIERFWPGPLTLVLPSRSDEPGATIAARAPDHPVALELLAALDEPIASSSANRAGAPPPSDAAAVLAGLGGELDLVVDGGPCRLAKPSTILDLSSGVARILRAGVIPEAALRPLIASWSDSG